MAYKRACDFMSSLSQPRFAFFANSPVNVSAQVFSTGGAYPILRGKPNIRSDNNNLDPEEGNFWKCPEEIGALIDHRAQKNGKERCRHRDKLTALAFLELPHDLLVVFFLCHRTFPFKRNSTSRPGQILSGTRWKISYENQRWSASRSWLFIFITAQDLSTL